jgi:hypothetical protein
MDQTLGPGRTQPGDKLTVPQLKQRLLSAVFNPVRGLLRAKDSLSILSSDQVKALTALDRRVTQQEDSLVTPFANYLAALPDRYDEPEVIAKALVMENALFDVVIDGMRQAGEIFTPDQINEFPPFLRASFDIKRLMTLRPRAGFSPDF